MGGTTMFPLIPLPIKEAVAPIINPYPVYCLDAIFGRVSNPEDIEAKTDQSKHLKPLPRERSAGSTKESTFAPPSVPGRSGKKRSRTSEDNLAI